MGITTLSLPVGSQLTVVANASSSGTLSKLSPMPGDTTAPTTITISASSRSIFGPYSTVTRWSIDSTVGAITYSTGFPPTEADQLPSGILTSGQAAGTGVVAAEYGDGVVHRTVLTITDLSIAMTDATTAGAHGSQKLYDFPAGPIAILGCAYDLTTLAGAGGLADGAALVGSLGSVTAGVDNATLTTTEADLIASTTGTLTAGAGTLKKHGSIIATPLDGTTTPVDAYLNLAVADADSSADDTVTVNGTVTMTWINLGDY